MRYAYDTASRPHPSIIKAQPIKHAINLHPILYLVQHSQYFSEKAKRQKGKQPLSSPRLASLSVVKRSQGTEKLAFLQTERPTCSPRTLRLDKGRSQVAKCDLPLLARIQAMLSTESSLQTLCISTDCNSVSLLNCAFTKTRPVYEAISWIYRCSFATAASIQPALAQTECEACAIISFHSVIIMPYRIYTAQETHMVMCPRTVHIDFHKLCASKPC